MSRYAFDAAWSPYPSPHEAKANGFEGMIRYLAPMSPSVQGKVWTKDEITAAHGQGLWVLGVFELEANRPTFGKATGISDCKSAEAQWESLGAPKDSTVAYAYDFDPDPSEIFAYAEGVRETATHPVMAYCSDAVADALFVRDLIDFFWQTESTGFRGRWPSPLANMIQHVNYDRPKMTGDYDENLVLSDFGQWGPQGTIGGDLTPDQAKQLQEIHDALAGTRPDSSNIEDAVLFKGPDGKLYRRLDRVEKALADIKAKLGM